MTVKLKKLYDNAQLPTYAKEGDAGMDIRSYSGGLHINLMPNETRMISCGFALEIPHGYFGSVRERSGLASTGIRLGGGVIDSGYRGEVKVILTNLSSSVYTFFHGDKIAQIIIQPCERAELVEVEELGESERGDAGFGSTGA